MTKFVFGKRSENNLLGVHPDLVRVARRALELTTVDFTVIEGLRTPARQRALVASGASQTLNSRHLTGHAIDIAPFIDGQVRWDWGPFFVLATAFRGACIELDIDVRWGGNWKALRDTTLPITAKSLSRTFPDGGHFELDRRKYP